MLPAVKTMQALARNYVPARSVAAAMIRRLAVLAWLIVLALPAAALADPPWSATQDVSLPHLFVDPVAVTASANGTALAWWSWQDGTGSGSRTGSSVASRAPGSGQFGAERAAPLGTVAVAGYAQSRAIALAERSIGPANLGRTRLSVAFGGTDGSFGALRTIADGPRLDRPVLARQREGRRGDRLLPGPRRDQRCA